MKRNHPLQRRVRADWMFWSIIAALGLLALTWHLYNDHTADRLQREIQQIDKDAHTRQQTH